MITRLSAAITTSNTAAAIIGVGMDEVICTLFFMSVVHGAIMIVESNKIRLSCTVMTWHAIRTCSCLQTCSGGNSRRICS